MLNVPANFIDARVARLATSDARAKPHCIPVCFVWVGQRVVIALDEKPKRVDVLRLKRVRNILENPQVSLVVDHYEEDWSRLRFIMLDAQASLSRLDCQELQALREKYPQYRPMDLHWGLRLEPEKWISWSA